MTENKKDANLSTGVLFSNRSSSYQARPSGEGAGSEAKPQWGNASSVFVVSSSSSISIIKQHYYLWRPDVKVINTCMKYQHASPFFKGSIYSVLAVSALMIVIYITGVISQQRTLKLQDWTSPPTLTNIQGTAQEEYRAGQSVIITYHILRQPVGCWATYIDVITGPVMHQFPPQLSQFIVEVPTRVDAPLFKTIPDGLPAGEYKWTQLTYPVCDNVLLDPISNDTGIVLTIVE